MAAGYDLGSAVLDRERVQRNQRIDDQRRMRARNGVVAIVLVHPLALVAGPWSHRRDAGYLEIRAQNAFHQLEQPVVHEDSVDRPCLGQQIVSVVRLLAVFFGDATADGVEDGGEARAQPLDGLFVEEVGHDGIAVFANAANRVLGVYWARGQR